MQNYKLLENNKGKQMNLGMANFLDTTKGMIMKGRTDKLNFIKMKKNPALPKIMSREREDKPQNENIIAKEISDKELL